MLLNYKKTKSLFFILFFILISNCSKKEEVIKPEEKIPLAKLYRSAFKEFESGNWNESISLFKKVEKDYFYSEWAPKATLMIIYMYFDSGDSIQTLKHISKFKKFYPANKNNDYVDYIKALTFYEQINVASKDITYAKEALKLFNFIQTNYPNSTYAQEAEFKKDLINEQLAGKHMYIARYYISKSLWIPAITRLKIIIKDYETTIYVVEALHRMVEIYYKLGNMQEAKKYASILGYNFNDSDWYKKTYKVVGDKAYVLEEKKTREKLKEKIKKIFKFSK